MPAQPARYRDSKPDDLLASALRTLAKEWMQRLSNTFLNRSLPPRPRVAAPASTEMSTSTATVNAPRHGQGERILYIDDEEPLVFLATRVLKRMGYSISGFSCAKDAIKTFRADPLQFDLVITDCNMPGASGLEVATELRAIRPDVPIVLCSGYITDEVRELASKAGIHEVLYKPSGMEEFGNAIHRLIAKDS